MIAACAWAACEDDDHRARLWCLPSDAPAWRGGGAWATHVQTPDVDGGALVIVLGGAAPSAAFAATRGRVRGFGDEDRLIVWDDDATWLVEHGAVSWIPGERRGVHRRLVRCGGAEGWDDPARPLPEGGRRAREAFPFPSGDGVVWVDHGWVYRRGERVDPIIDLGGDGALEVGPGGALLIGDADALTHGAGPGRRPAPLPVELDARAPLAWDADGGRVGGVTVDGQPVDIDLTSLRHHPRPRARLPRLPEVRLAPAGAAAHAPGWVVGPAASAWSTADGGQHRAGRIPPGAAVIADDELFIVEADGAAARMPLTGKRVRALTELPLHPGERAEAIGAGRDRVVARTSAGRLWRLKDDDWITARTWPAPPPLVRPTGAWAASGLWQADPGWAWHPGGVLVRLPR